MSWQDPYGQYGQSPYGQQQGWQDPYAHQYATQQPGYGYYGPPGAPYQSTSNGATIAALICNIVCAVLCCGGIAWIPGIILSAVALNKNNTDPESARQYTTWSWVCFGINIVLGIVLAIVYFAFLAHTESSTSTTY